MAIGKTDGFGGLALQMPKDNKEKNNGASKGKEASGLKTLNQRQKEILVRMAQGMTVYAISRELRVSEDTIRFHKKNIFDKLDANCTVLAVVNAIKNNYIKLSDI